jgi:hypothetical protein
MKKLVLVCLLAIAGLSIAVEAQHPSTIISQDVPPPSCAPDCPFAR